MGDGRWKGFVMRGSGTVGGRGWEDVICDGGGVLWSM